MDLILNHYNPVYNLALLSLKIHFNIKRHLRQDLLSGVPCSCFPTKILHAFFFSSMSIICHTFRIGAPYFHQPKRVLFGELKKNLFSMKLPLSFCPPPFLFLNVLLSTLASNILNIYSSQSNLMYVQVQ